MKQGALQSLLRNLSRGLAVALLALGALSAVPARAAERVQVADPYLELRTGPGRGYPIFHVAAREE